jgi:hypothetical protein
VSSFRPRRVLALALPLVVLAVLPSVAPAKKLKVGIGENSPSMFTDPLFGQLHVKDARLVVSYNVMTSGDDELGRVRAYLAAAQAAGVRPLVTFEHARGDATVCKAMPAAPQCRLPSPAEYDYNLRLFLSAFPTVREIVPWNEINHFTQPTAKKPKVAAKFTKIARKACKGCTVVVADILDQANNPSAKRPKFGSTIKYIKRFRKAYKGPRKVCGVHNYSDVNRFRKAGTKALVKALGCKQIWLTEAGGIFSFPGFSPSPKRQLKATKYLFKLARSVKRVKRVYVYNYYGGVTPRFDAGLVAGGVPRPAFGEVVKQVKAKAKKVKKAKPKKRRHAKRRHHHR